MSRVNKYRALKTEPKAYVHGWNGGDQTKSAWVYGSAVIPVYINTYPTNRMEMVIDVNYDELDYWQPSYSICDVIPNTVGQYIGVNDKNGKEVYEWDIVRTNSGRLCKVVWFSSPKHQGWDLIPIETKNPVPKERELWSDLEVIGNVYENADLLKEANSNE